jgi:hypothetical protein
MKPDMVDSEPGTLHQPCDAHPTLHVQLAVEATEAKEKSKAAVLEVAAMVEETTRMQQQYVDTIAALQDKVNSAADPNAKVSEVQSPGAGCQSLAAHKSIAGQLPGK